MKITRICYRFGLFSLLASLLSACQPQAIKGSAPANENTLTIPYEKHVLENGLTVLLHEDDSDPVVHVDVTYHVGSSREEYGRSGFAHLFEHMMFQGSQNVADEEHIKLVTEAGGTMNGTTNRDRTNYFETVPSNHLETMLWLEADRMGFFLEGITQEKFEVQRETVKNEKQQNYDNRPYGRAFELIAKSLYPPQHPYSWLTIGDLEDLDQASADDLRDFFLRWYGPNNAALTIAGDIDVEQTLQLVNKYFGGIARGPEIPPLKAPEVAIDQDRYVSYYDSNIRFPAVTMSFPTVERFHPDAPALQCLSQILGSGKGSYLYQNLIANQKAIQASATHRSDELAGEFFMFVLPYPGTSLSEFEQELRNTLDEFEQSGVSDDDIAKFKAGYEMRFIQGLEKVSGKASKLAFYETFANNPGYFEQELSAHLNVTKEDVMRVYNTYIKNQPSVILSILAEPEQAPAQADNFDIKKPNLKHLNKKREPLQYVKAEDNFDRSKKPESGAAKLASPPQYWQDNLKGNISLTGSKSDELPLIVLLIQLQGGSLLDIGNNQKWGLSALTASLMNTSTQNYSEKAIAEELEKLGSSIQISAGSQRFNITVTTLRKHYDATMALLEEKLLRPAFEAQEFDRIKTQMIESSLSSTKSVSAIASSVYDTLIYGSEHIFGIPQTEYVETLKTIQLDDVKQFYKRAFSAENAEIVSVGDIEKSELLSKFDFLYALPGNSANALDLPDSPTYDNTTLFFVDKPQAAQSEIRVGFLTDTPLDANGTYFRKGLMNFPLGGAFNSRINLNLREDKGVTYGARSGFDSSEIPGPFTVSTSVKKNATALSVEEIIKELSDYRRDGITEPELTFMKDAIVQRDALKYESIRQKSSFLAKIQRFDFAPDFVDRQKHILQSISKQEIDALAREHLLTEKLIILVVGDKANVFEPLQKLGYPIVELAADGQRVGKE